VGVRARARPLSPLPGERAAADLRAAKLTRLLFGFICLALQFVVMATKEDMNANAEYIRMGDEIVDVPGGPNNNNYANVMLIVELAMRSVPIELCTRYAK